MGITVPFEAKKEDKVTGKGDKERPLLLVCKHALHWYYTLFYFDSTINIIQTLLHL